MIPGEILYGDGDVACLPDRPVRVLRVTNTGDRPIQVGSHYHLAEANPALELDRDLARGCRLAIPAGTSERFEPGLARDVEVIAYGGARIVAGFRGEVAGALDGPDPAADDRLDPAADDRLDPAADDRLDPAADDGVDPAADDGLDPAADDGVDGGTRQEDGRG